MRALESLRAAIAEIGKGEDDVSKRAFASASAALAEVEAHFGQRRGWESSLLSGVDESYITRCDEVGEGAYQMRARHGVVEVSEYNFGDPTTQTDATILAKVRADIVDSLKVEIVRRDVAHASDRDLLEALDAAERDGGDDVGEIRVAAHDRGLRRLG